MGAIDLLRDLMAEGVEFEADGNRIRKALGGRYVFVERFVLPREVKANLPVVIEAAYRQFRSSQRLDAPAKSRRRPESCYW